MTLVLVERDASPSGSTNKPRNERKVANRTRHRTHTRPPDPTDKRGALQDTRGATKTGAEYHLPVYTEPELATPTVAPPTQGARGKVMCMQDVASSGERDDRDEHTAGIIHSHTQCRLLPVTQVTSRKNGLKTKQKGHKAKGQTPSPCRQGEQAVREPAPTLRSCARSGSARRRRRIRRPHPSGRCNAAARALQQRRRLEHR